MNSQSSLLKRLLRSYPVKAVKEHFSITGESQDSAIDSIVVSNSAAAIKDFAYSHFNYTKQHIYVYSLGKNHNFKSLKTGDIPHEIIKQSTAANEHLVFCLAEVTFEVISLHLGNAAPVKVKFYQPVLIHAIGRYLVIRLTVLESKLTPFFPSNATLFNLTKAVDEKAIIADVLPAFVHASPMKADLNKGVKQLWESDVVDSREVKFKKATSVSKEVMDEEFMVKDKLPDVYKQLMAAPLNKTIFKYKKEDGYICDHFVCDPSNGEIGIPLYSKDDQQVQNIINEIIRNN